MNLIDASARWWKCFSLRSCLERLAKARCTVRDGGNAEKLLGIETNQQMKQVIAKCNGKEVANSQANQKHS